MAVAVGGVGTAGFPPEKKKLYAAFELGAGAKPIVPSGSREEQG